MLADLQVALVLRVEKVIHFLVVDLDERDLYGEGESRGCLLVDALDIAEQ